MASRIVVFLHAMTLPSVNFPCNVSFSPRLAGVNYALTVQDILLDVFLMWAMESPCNVAIHYRKRALNDLNRAMQVIWNRAKERSYWTSSKLELTFPANQGKINLPGNVQNVTGHARLASNLKTLAPIGSLSELEQFSDLFLDGETPDRPVAYYIDREATSENDPASCSIHITPAPTEATVILLEVVNEAPRYTWEDYTARTVVPIPHKYVESLLLPAVRYYASCFWLFAGGEAQQKSLMMEYLDVARQIGLADPLPGLSGDNMNDRKEAVAPK
jgi:hypothetical protein